MKNGKWYIGTMNDGLFIIDRPPKPVPVDYLTIGDPELKVIAAMGNDKIRAEEIVAAHNEVVNKLRAKSSPRNSAKTDAVRSSMVSHEE
jgi:hypothetical protein